MGETTKKGRMIQHLERCKECGYCVQNCPSGALSFSDVYNQKGYRCVAIDHDKCTRCTVCITVCPDYVYEKVED
ncbi:MAG TPA: 4Fe-4S dicluster domain-containing protein [Candidatus Mailhella merdavium]|nr:4Fe-4S dicluster domain-containing protein [Candidatus Mailhella merdavium]